MSIMNSLLAQFCTSNPKWLTRRNSIRAINKRLRSKYSDDHFLLPLLYYSKKYLAQAEAKFKQLNTIGYFSTIGYKSVYYLILSYIINGELSPELQMLPKIRALN